MKVEEFLTDYYNGEYPNLRLGQAFVNKFGYRDMPELFYQENEIIALEEIFKLKEEHQLP